jgi:hypothetical protein
MRRRNYDIDAGACGGLDLSAHPGGYLDCPDNSEALYPALQGLNVVRIGDDNEFGSEFKDLLGKQLKILTGAEGGDMKSVSRVSDDGQTLPPDRTRGP